MSDGPNNQPEFTDAEIAEVRRRAETDEYYEECADFLRRTVLNKMAIPSFRTKKELRWLWKIKKDLAKNG